MLPPVEVTPPASKAFRYSRATDLRCSSVMDCVETAMSSLLSRVPGWKVGVDVQPHSLGVGVLVHGLEPHLAAVAGVAEPAERRARVDALVGVDPHHARPDGVGDAVGPLDVAGPQA